MKKNTYYRAILERNNVIKPFFFGLFMMIASYPKLVLEVFLRKSMGERYFNLASAITVGILLACLPLSLGVFRSLNYLSIITINWAYYVFLAVYLVFSLKRHFEIKREPSVFDFAKFSNSTGKSWDVFDRITLPAILGKGEKKELTRRQRDIYAEPLVFFIPGLLITWIIPGFLGPLLIFCSIVYSLSYAGQWLAGDHFIMNKIDEMLANKDMSETFVNDLPSKVGFKFYGRKPRTDEMREEILDQIIIDDDGEEVK